MDELNPLPASFNQPGSAKNHEMVRHRRARQAVTRRHIARQTVAAGRPVGIEPSNHRKPRRLRQSVQNAGQWNVVEIGMGEAAHAADLATLSDKFKIFPYSEVLN